MATHFSLTTVLQDHSKGGQYRILHLHVQVDNCVSENKNNYFIGYVGTLVRLETIETAEIHFMMVGHTHIKMDKIFSR